jgi:phenylacetate-CoA ligase
MRFGEGISEFVTGHVSFPLSNYLMNRRGIMSGFRKLALSDRLNQQQIDMLQVGKLKSLLSYAISNVPYYRELCKEVGLEPGDIRSVEDIRWIPCLSREDVVTHRHRLIDSRLVNYALAADGSGRGAGEPMPFARFRRNRIVRNTSSGSTGAPTIFYEDGSRSALNWALELRLKSWYGVGPGAREARMVRLSTSALGTVKNNALRDLLWNQFILPGVNLSDDDYAACVEKISMNRPRVLWGFTSALTGLADYLRRMAIDPYRWGIRLVVGWAAPVYEHEYRLLNDVFACPVSNIYSAREVGHVAGMCPDGSFHVNQEHFIVEKDKISGELLVTALDISPMPFIRYRMGDVGSVALSRCGCGRTLQVIEDLLGRTGEIFTTREGRMISPNFWCRTFMDGRFAEAVKRFQVIYRGDDALIVRMVRGENFSNDVELHLRSHLERNFDQGFTIGFEYVEEIKPLLSGKYRMVIHEW